MPTPTAVPAGQRVVGYYTSWSVYARSFFVASIPAAGLTHVNYAFANIAADGTIVMGDPYADSDEFYPGDSWDAGAQRGSFHQLQILKQSYPQLRTLISVGGWTWSGSFSDVALTPTSRAVFAQSCVDFVVAHGFDGVDIDWEYPVGGGLSSNTVRPEDGRNYTLLLRALRSALDARGAADGRSYLLTIAAPAGPSNMANLELASIGAVVDWLNIMAYDFHGGWDATTGFNAPLFASSADPATDVSIRTQFNGAAAVEAYLAAGVPAAKIVLGVPFYGRGYAGVPDVNGGLYQPFTGLPAGTWEAGVFDWKDLAASYVPTLRRSFDAEAEVPWLYDPARRVMISYDDPESLGLKAGYVKANGLGGVMIWELSSDDAGHSLLNALNAGLGR